MKALTIIAGGIPRCVYCGCDDPRALEINHINGGGKKEQKERQQARSGATLYRAIINGERETNDLEVTCRLCNNRHYLIQKYGGDIDKWDIKWETN